LKDTSLIISDAFVQANTIKGFRFLDHAGVIMNRWIEEFPTHQVDPNGLHMEAKDSVLREFRVNTDRIWLRFSFPETVQFVARQAQSMITEICNMLGVKDCRRVGMRLQYIAGVTAPNEAMIQLASKFLLPEWVNSIKTSESTDAFGVIVGFQEGQLKVKIRANVVR